MSATICDVLLDDCSRDALQDAIDKGYSCFPLYGRKCISCGQELPIVAFTLTEDDIRKLTGYNMVYRSLGVVWDTTDLCGACNWGESALIDPEEW